MSVKKQAFKIDKKNGIRWLVHSSRMWNFWCNLLVSVFIFNLLWNKLNRWWSVEKEVIVFGIRLELESHVTNIWVWIFVEYILVLHIVMINHVINWPTVSYRYSELNCRSGASRKSGGAERSGERALQKNDGAERSAERERSGERKLQD